MLAGWILSVGHFPRFGANETPVDELVSDFRWDWRIIHIVSRVQQSDNAVYSSYDPTMISKDVVVSLDIARDAYWQAKEGDPGRDSTKNPLE